ncbi:NUDIX hydrolase [Planotetraspora kaengkrachanensis]|uniref:NUDIX hydrolase n=1 Tax=Planotetraspora kaengkrachanensis TaxID=575193 RepID=UPI0035711490
MDETLEHAVVREVLEETGIRVKPEVLTGVYKNMNLGVVSLTFRCHPIGGEPRPSDGALESTWLTLLWAAGSRTVLAAPCSTRLIGAVEQGHQGRDSMLLGVTLRMDESARRAAQVGEEGNPVGPPCALYSPVNRM